MALESEQTVGGAYPMMSFHGNSKVTKTVTATVGAPALNGSVTSRGSNLDSSAVAAGPVSTAAQPLSVPAITKSVLAAHGDAQLPKNELFSFVNFLSFFSSLCLTFYHKITKIFSFVAARFESFIFSNFYVPLVSRSTIAQQHVSPALYNFPATLEYGLLKRRMNCIPLLLFSYGFISLAQAEHLRYVRRFSDLPKPLRASILRLRRSAILVKVSQDHVQNLLDREDFTSAYEVLSLRVLLKSSNVFLATPFSTAEPKPTMEFSTPSVPALGGARAVLTQLPTSARAAGLNKKWSPLLYPTQAVDQKINYDRSATRIDTLRESNYVRTYPENIPQPRQPEHFSEVLRSTIAGRFLPRGAPGSSAVPVNFNRSWARKPISDRTLAPQHAGLSNIFEGLSYSKEALASAEQAMSINRFLDTRGNRLVFGWEANQWNRWSGITSLFSTVQADRNYFQIAYRLLSRYYFSLLAAEFPDYTVAAVQGTQVNLHGLNTIVTTPVAQPGVPPPPVANPEAPLFTNAAFLGLQSGTAQFIDAEGLSREELLEMLSAIVPVAEDNIPLLRAPPPRAQDYFVAPTRYTYQNGVTDVFIHFGNNPLPDMAQLAADVHCAPQAPMILSVLRYLAMRHGASNDIEDALEVLMSRLVMYTRSPQLRGLKPNAPNNVFINADGHYEMHMPLAKTGSAYFDSFMVPHPATGSLPMFASLRINSIINNGVLFAQARASALNWAAAAWSMTGRAWNATPGAERNSYVRNHIDVFLRKYSSDILNLWTSNHNNAMAFHVGWSMSAAARCTEANVVVNWWADHHTPTLTNSYLELWQVENLPSHQVLPWDDRENPSTVSWPSNTPFPIHDAYSFAASLNVQVARDTPVEVGRTYMGDGGAVANAQHFAAVGSLTGFRFEGANNDPKISLARWRQRHSFQFPAAPASQAPVWMADAGSPFADFLAPGSMPMHNIEANVSYSFGVNAAADISALDRRYTAQLWFDAARQVPRRSLMVNYVSPFPDRREFSSLQDYSIIVWEKENAYAGMSLVPVDFSPVSMADYKPAANLTFPSLTRPSAVDVSDVARNPRVASSKRAPRAAASDVLARFKEFHQPAPPLVDTLPDAQAPAANLSYAPKYPVEQAQVPDDFKYYQPVVEEDRVHVEPASTPDAYDRLSKQQLKLAIENNMQLLAKIQNSPLLGELDLEAERKKQEAFKAAEAQRNERIQKRASYVPLTPRRARPVLDPKPVPVKPAPVHGKLNDQILRHQPAQINDYAAHEVQKEVPILGRPLPTKSTHNPFDDLAADKKAEADGPPGSRVPPREYNYDEFVKDQLPTVPFGHASADVGVQDGFATDALAKN